MTKLAGLCMGNRVRGEAMENLLSSTDTLGELGTKTSTWRVC